MDTIQQMLGLVSAALPLTVAVTMPIASLRVDSGQSTFSVAVSEDQSSGGYQIQFDCVRACKSVVNYREPVDDSPLGLFTRDQDGLLFSLWSAGSAYRVRIWRVTDNGVSKVAELSSRGRPDFLSDKSGRAVIRTYESTGDHRRSNHWTYEQGGFVPSRR